MKISDLMSSALVLSSFASGQPETGKSLSKPSGSYLGSPSARIGHGLPQPPPARMHPRGFSNATAHDMNQTSPGNNQTYNPDDGKWGPNDFKAVAIPIGSLLGFGATAGIVLGCAKSKEKYDRIQQQPQDENVELRRLGS